MNSLGPPLFYLLFYYQNLFVTFLNYMYIKINIIAIFYVKLILLVFNAILMLD